MRSEQVFKWRLAEQALQLAQLLLKGAMLGRRG
jgi:hypothetical protein